MRVLVTGYEPAYGIKKTPSGDIARMISDGAVFINGVDTFGLVLPQSFEDQGQLLRSEMGVVRPDFLVMLGSTLKPGKIAIEEFALNVIDSKCGDNLKIPVKRPYISASGPAAYRTNIDIIGSLMRTPDPKRFSHHYNAGTHVCNALYYEALDYITRYDPRCKAVFVHIPFPNEYGVCDDLDGGVTLADTVSSVRDFITGMIMHYGPVSGLRG